MPRLHFAASLPAMEEILRHHASRALHIQIHMQCCACGLAFLPGDRIVALLCIDNVMKVYDLYTFTEDKYCAQGLFDEWCKIPGCPVCLSANESATLHADCLQLFASKCDVNDKFQRLWTAATRMYPWRQAAPLLLPRRSYNMSHVVSEAYKLPGLRTLVPELVEMIRGNSSPHIIWRYCSVLQLAQELEVATQNELVTYPLHKVYSWYRGGLPIIKEDIRYSTQLIRLTIDSRGIRKIERIAKRTQACEFQPGFEVFTIIEPPNQFSMVKADFKFGMCRLQVPDAADIEIWDIPTPPSLYPLSPPLCARFATIEMNPRYCKGITFFIIGYSIIATHNHTARVPTALGTFESLEPQCQMSAAWLYVPLTPQDEVTAFAMRIPTSGTDPFQSPCLILRMKSGDVLIGAHINQQALEMRWATGRQPTLIHNVTSYAITAALAHPRQGGITITTVESAVGPFRDACFSSASLESVLRTQVCRDESYGICRGIIIEYHDGTKRALGQCRLGLDNVQTYANPSRFCYAAATHHRPHTRFVFQSLRVAFTSTPQHYHQDIDSKWECCKMEGTVHLWFTADQAKLEVISA